VASVYGGGTLAPNGSIYVPPYTPTTVLKLLSPYSINENLALSPLFSKY
jgi:hypothetical protein